MGCSVPVCSQMAPLSCEGTDCSQPAPHELAAHTLLLLVGTSPAVSLPQRLHELQHSPASIFHPCRKEAKGVSQGLPDPPLGTALGTGAGKRTMDKPGGGTELPPQCSPRNQTVHKAKWPGHSQTPSCHGSALSNTCTNSLQAGGTEKHGFVVAARQRRDSWSLFPALTQTARPGCFTPLLPQRCCS